MVAVMRHADESLRAPQVDTRRQVRGAWWCVASLPLALVIGFVGAELVASALGHEGEGLPTWWVGAAALLVAVVPLAVPTWVAWRLRGKARTRGDHRADVPAYLLLVLGGAFVAVNLFSWLMRVLLESP
jgi:hypothetical protein